MAIPVPRSCAPPEPTPARSSTTWQATCPTSTSTHSRSHRGPPSPQPFVSRPASAIRAQVRRMVAVARRKPQPGLGGSPSGLGTPASSRRQVAARVFFATMDYAEPPPEEVAAMVVTDVRLPAEETEEGQWRELPFHTARPEIGKNWASGRKRECVATWQAGVRPAPHLPDPVAQRRRTGCAGCRVGRHQRPRSSWPSTPGAFPVSPRTSRNGWKPGQTSPRCPDRRAAPPKPRQSCGAVTRRSPVTAGQHRAALDDSLRVIRYPTRSNEPLPTSKKPSPKGGRRLAPPAGLEPAAKRLEGACSIH